MIFTTAGLSTADNSHLIRNKKESGELDTALPAMMEELSWEQTHAPPQACRMPPYRTTKGDRSRAAGNDALVMTSRRFRFAMYAIAYTVQSNEDFGLLQRR